MKFLLLMLVSTSLLAAPAMTKQGAYELNRTGPVQKKYHVGTKLFDAQQFGTKAIWDYSVSGGAANADIPLKDSEGFNVTLPAGAVVKDCMIDVVTQPTSSTSSGSLAFSSKAVADLKAAAFVAAYTTTSRIACLPDGTVGNSIKTTSELTLKMRVGSEALTAGKVNVWVEYVISE